MSAPRPCFRAEFREAPGAPWEPLSRLSARQALRNQKKRKRGRRPPEIQQSRLQAERIAAHWAGYTWPQYLALPGDDRWVDTVRYSDCKAWVIAAHNVQMELEGLRNTMWD